MFPVKDTVIAALNRSSELSTYFCAFFKRLPATISALIFSSEYGSEIPMAAYALVCTSVETSAEFLPSLNSFEKVSNAADKESNSVPLSASLDWKRTLFNRHGTHSG